MRLRSERDGCNAVAGFRQPRAAAERESESRDNQHQCTDDKHGRVIGARGVLDGAREIRRDEAGEIADGVDQRDARGGSGAGSAQKFGNAEKIAQAVTVITATVAAGDCMYSATGMLAAPISAGTPMCQARTPCFVALRLQRNSASAAGRYGIAVIKPFWNTLKCVPNWPSKPPMIVGRKNASA